MTKPKPPPYINAGADISPDGRYRYQLWREWRGVATHDRWRWFGVKDGDGQEFGEPKSLLFIMLNPSTADAEKDDPTIRKCVGFAKALKYDRVEIVNLFAYRATDPRQLRLASNGDVYGERNQEVIQEAAHGDSCAGAIVAAWGVDGCYNGQDETVMGWLGGRHVWALGPLTAGGMPRHPLYAPYTSPLIRYHGRR